MIPYRTAKHLRYPWKLLLEPGDYFVVPYEVATLDHMKRTVATHNHNYIGYTIHECWAMKDCSWVVLFSKTYERDDLYLRYRATVNFDGWS